jgi:hypothetical protein
MGFIKNEKLTTQNYIPHNYKKIMKKLIVFIVSILFITTNILGQNVGINTETPEAALDVNGDIIIRPGTIAVSDGITLSLDVNTARFSYYRLEGPTADFTLAGIAAGVDGRQLTLFNRSGFVMQLNNEDATVTATDMIVTGTNADITIPNKGIINLQYDATEGKWIVKSSSKGSISVTGGFWDTDGTNIYNINAGNVGIGTSSPTTAKLSIQTPINSTGWTHIGGADSIVVTEGVGGVSASIGTITNHAFRIHTNGIGKLSIYPGGEVVVGSNSTGSFGKFSVETPNNSYGISHISTGGNIIATNIGGTSAGIGTFSNTNMRIFCNSASKIFIAAATGNVGIGTDNPTYKLSVLGNIRSTEVVVETGWADYVFDEKYVLPPLSEVEKFIKQNKHLPNIPTAAEIEKNGLFLGDTQKKMIEKIEELTLYVIDLKKEIELLKLKK